MRFFSKVSVFPAVTSSLEHTSQNESVVGPLLPRSVRLFVVVVVSDVVNLQYLLSSSQKTSLQSEMLSFNYYIIICFLSNNAKKLKISYTVPLFQFTEEEPK